MAEILRLNAISVVRTEGNARTVTEQQLCSDLVLTLLLSFRQ